MAKQANSYVASNEKFIQQNEVQSYLTALFIGQGPYALVR
jgi:hypothetical protein